MTNIIIQAIEDGAASLKALVISNAPTIFSDLEKLALQLEPAIVDALETAVTMIVAGAAAETPVAPLAAAIETATMNILVQQGRPVLETDALAIKGVILAKIATLGAAATANAPPAPVATTDAPAAS